MNIRSIKEYNDLKGKRVLVRADLNEPIHSGKLLDTFRIEKALPLITLLKNAGARTILISHLSGDPDDHGRTLGLVAQYLEKHIPVTFVKDILSDSAKNILDHMSDGDVVLAENIRRYKEELSNDESFARKLASLADIYVNECFPASHREHASVVGVPKFLPSFAGLQLEEEMKHLSVAFDPPRPSTLLLGGGKFRTKIPLAKKFLNIADHVFVGGAPANDFFILKGNKVGRSLTSGVDFGLKEVVDHERLLLPTDVRVQEERGIISVKKIGQIGVTDKIVDIGPESVKEIEKLVNGSKFVFWNGPLGEYEKGFTRGTEAVARIIGNSGTYSILGGGDSVAVISTLGLRNQFTFVSTAGGSMVEFLAEGTLPGIEVLKQSQKF